MTVASSDNFASLEACNCNRSKLYLCYSDVEDSMSATIFSILYHVWHRTEAAGEAEIEMMGFCL